VDHNLHHLALHLSEIGDCKLKKKKQKKKQKTIFSGFQKKLLQQSLTKKKNC
jgi:hypothetical protein